MPMKVAIDEYHGFPLVRVAGEIDGSSVIEFRRAVMGAPAMRGNAVVIELSEVRYIESAAIGVLIEAHGVSEARGVGMVVACPEIAIARILRLSGLHHVVPVFEDVDSAVEFLSNRRIGGEPSRD